MNFLTNGRMRWTGRLLLSQPATTLGFEALYRAIWAKDEREQETEHA
jgi:hypothetical protein